MVLKREFSEGRKKRMMRTLMSRRIRATGPDEATVQAVVIRERGCCLVCGDPLNGARGVGWSIHHRRGRDGKPDSHTVQNLIAVCGGDNVTGCHGRIHQRRSESQPAGWWLSRVAGTDPLTVPLLVDRESRWVYLTAAGTYAHEAPGVEG